MAHFGLGGAAGGGPILRGGAAEDEELPEPEEDAEGDRHGEEDEAITAEGGFGVGEGPSERGATDDESGDDTEDAPGDAGFAGAFAAEHDAEADADHREIPEEGKE